MAWNFLAMTVSGAEARSAKLRNAAAGLREAGLVRKTRILAGLMPAKGQERVFDPKPKRFRIQFAGATPDRGSSILREAEIEASDLSTAIITAANITWPPRTIGLRIFNGEGDEVFSRQRADRR